MERRKGYVENGALHCPKRHSGDIAEVSILTSIRDVGRVNGGVLMVSTQQDDGDPEVEHYHCRICFTNFDLPDGVMVDYTDEV